jgi:hypothetical protein
MVRTAELRTVTARVIFWSSNEFVRRESVYEVVVLRIPLMTRPIYAVVVLYRSAFEKLASTNDAAAMATSAKTIARLE